MTKSNIAIIKKTSKPKHSIVYKSYWNFARKRQDVYLKRIAGHDSPWTDDPILLKYKFTNTFRASDRVSQYLIKNVIYKNKYNLEDQFFRILLFKIFNKIETWNHLETELGDITYSRSSLTKIEKILGQLKGQGQTIYSSAYIMPSGGKGFRYPYKHVMHLNLLKLMMKDRLPQKISSVHSMEESFRLLRSYPTIGDFLAYQLVTDINYSEITDFSEMDFVIPGPGARDGLKKCFTSFGDLTESEVIKYVAENQYRHCEELGIAPPNLWGRPLQLIDCQNIFCEIDKYSRVAHPNIKGRSGRTRIKQTYKPSGDLSKPFFPPKWGINKSIRESFKNKDRNLKKASREHRLAVPNLL